MIILDSIAASVRADFEEDEFSQRGKTLNAIAKELKQLAGVFQLAVLITNHVVDRVTSLSTDYGASKPHEARQGNLAVMISSGRAVLPALGLGWSNCVNTRLVVSRLHSSTAPGGSMGMPALTGKPHLRRLHVQLAPHLPFQECYYVVEGLGVRGAEDDQNVAGYDRSHGKHHQPPANDTNRAVVELANGPYGCQRGEAVRIPFQALEGQNATSPRGKT